jgi:hypothetical protein
LLSGKKTRRWGATATEENNMSQKDAITIATRSLALMMIVWAFAEVSYLPERIQSLQATTGDITT